MEEFVSFIDILQEYQKELGLLLQIGERRITLEPKAFTRPLLSVFISNAICKWTIVATPVQQM